MRVRGIAFSLVVGLLGWGFLLLVAPRLPGVEVVSMDEGIAPFALFVIVILAARGMAFRVVEEAVLSLDSAFYVAAAFCLGAVPAGRMVAFTLTLDALIRLVIADRKGRVPEDGGTEALAYVLYFGGISGALLVACGWLFRVDELVTVHRPAVVALRLVAVAGTFLVAHYALQGLRLVMLGRSWRSYLHDIALPGMVAEAAVMPLAVVLVVLYQPGHQLAFLLLCATYLLLHFVFSRLRRASHDLAQRVRDLETLGATARTRASALELEELVETVARETCRAIPTAEAVALVHRGSERDTERLVVDSYDRDGDHFARFTIARGAGAVGRVIAEQRPLLIHDLATSDVPLGAAGPEGVSSWLGVPIFMGGGVEGVLAIQSRQIAAFGLAQQRLLESIGHQVAASLQNAHLYQMAMVDSLTGLFVRRYFDARIEEEIERSKRYGQPFSVVMIDLDDFKALNDTHGHLVGDRVLRSVASIVRGQMRGVDTAARYGGEELALILPRTEMVAAYNQAERIRAAIADHRVAVDPGAGESEVIGVTASFGIAAYPESDAQSAEELVRRADKAMYRAKKTGKNRVELYWADEPSEPMGKPLTH